MAHPVIDADECIACGVCVDSCPAGVLELQDVATVADEDYLRRLWRLPGRLPRWRDHRDRRGVTTPPLAHSKVTVHKKGGLPHRRGGLLLFV